MLLENEKWRIKQISNSKITIDTLKDAFIVQLYHLELVLIKEIGVPSFFSLSLVELRGKLIEINL